jgi:hypothetical protein
MKDEAVLLRRELDKIVVRRGRCVRPKLRARVAAWLVSQRATGRSTSELASALGVAPGTVIRWSSSKSSRAMVRVRVVPAPDPVRTVRVVSPSGFWIDGVTVAEAVAVLRELG